MAKRKLRDNLQRAARIQMLRLERYVRARPHHRYLSMRLLRLKFLLDTEVHEKYIREAYDILSEKAPAADKVGGLHILLVVRDVLIEHGESVRANKASAPSLETRYTILKTRNEVHPMCPIKRKLPQQIEFLQVLGADMEAMAIMLYCEQRLVKDGLILEDEKIKATNAIFEVNNEAEKCLNDLRMIHLS